MSFPEFEFQGLLSQYGLTESVSLSLPVAAPQPFVAPAAPVEGEFEPVGRAFFRRLCQHLNIDDVSASRAVSTKQEVDPEAARLLKRFDINRKVKLDDYYSLLGLEATNVFSTDAQIQEAYRVASLYCHPDKALPEQRAHAEARFKALQKGYETLRDPVLRRVYDSSMPFDDDIPSGLDEDEDFFETFGPVFAANARFSMVTPALELGDDSTPLEQVNKFYDFWFGFKSWREFAHEDEHTIDDQVGREEKRWMQRQNEKLRRAKKKEEITRVRKLVETAQKHDPRILRHIRAQQEQKNAAKFAKIASKLAEEEAKRKEEEEARVAELARVEEEAKRKDENKNIKQNVKNAKKEIRKRQRQLDSFLTSQGFDDVAFSDVLAALDMDGLNALKNALIAATKADQSNPDEPALVALIDLLKGRNSAADEEKKAKQEQLEKARQAEELAKQKAEEARLASWTADECEILAKAVAKFNLGTANRFRNITEMLNRDAKKKDPAHVDRKEKDVIRKLKTDELKRHEAHMERLNLLGNVASEDTGSAASGTEEEWNSEQQRALEKALQTVEKTASFWEDIAKLIEGKTVDQIKSRVRDIRQQLLAMKQQ